MRLKLPYLHDDIQDTITSILQWHVYWEVFLILFYRYFLKAVFHHGRWIIDVTPDPDLDCVWATQDGSVALAVGDRCYPLGVALRAAREIQRQLARRKPRITLADLDWLGRRAFKVAREYPAPHWQWLDPVKGQLPELTATLRQRLNGRLLSGPEIRALLGVGDGGSWSTHEALLHNEVLNGEAQRFPGVDLDEIGRPVCRRCGEKSNLALVDCAYCGGCSWVCRACESLTPVRDCLPLYQFSYCKPRTIVPHDPLRMTRTLTKLQNKASVELEKFCLDGEKQEFLVWAVCGAGKTELVYSAINAMVRKGLCVLYAVPRRDVVKEIGERLAEAFPGLPISVLLGGQGRKDETGAAIVVATTHQVLRYVSHFDLAVLDEADAYPYEDSRMLHFGLKRSISPGGRLIYLTATPSRELRERLAKGEIAGFRIPVRHHGRPLPVPDIWLKRIPELKKQDTTQFMSDMEGILNTAHVRKTPLLVFLPSVALVESFGQYFQRQELAKKFPTGWVYAGHPRRDEIIQRFREGEIKVLITTTVLERGLNFPGVEVLVLHADYERIFDAESLVQIAGRVGRYPSHPGGRIIFWGSRVSGAMKEAIANIEEMNRLAKEAGFFINREGFEDEVGL
jgi:competence protein ComFA